MTAVLARACVLASVLAAAAVPSGAGDTPGAAVADVGGRPIVLPPPPGWVLADTGSDDARAPFTRFVSNDERVLAGFAPRMDPARPSGESLMKLALAASPASLGTEDVDAARFAAIVASFRESLPGAEVVFQDPDAAGILVLVQAQTESGEPVADYVSATLILLARVKSRFVRLGLFDFTASAEKAEAFRATAVGWLVALRAANP